MQVEEDKFIELTEEDIFKINFIRSTIEEEVSCQRVVRGMLDEGYGIAICVQQREGQLTPDALEYALGLLSKELKDVVVKKIAKSSSPCN